MKNGPRCFSCGNYGHIRKDCPKVKNFKKEKRQNQTARSNFATFSANNLMNSEDWYFDTGATSHLCSSEDVMKDFVPSNANCVKIADGTMLQSAGVGKILILLKSKNTMDAKDVLYCARFVDKSFGSE